VVASIEIVTGASAVFSDSGVAVFLVVDFANGGIQTILLLDVMLLYRGSFFDILKHNFVNRINNILSI
jgi:hypothetical protein